jgi:N-acetylmuramoyl-L-alanine amidase
VGFITNADTEHNLHLPAYRQRIAEALCLGLARYGREAAPKR